MHTMHLLPGVAIQPNLEFKTRPKQLLGFLPLVIALPGGTHHLSNGAAHFKKCKQLFEQQHLLLLTSGGQISNQYLNVGSYFQHQSKLYIYGSLRLLFSCIGV
jgi:hypothetical protein